MTETMETTAQSLPTDAAPPHSGSRGNFHFLLAAGILVIATTAWYSVIQAKGWWPLKKPVPWPVREEVVDGKKAVWRMEVSPDSRWLNMAADCPPFRKLQRSDFPDGDKDVDGEQIYNSSILSSLNISGSLTASQLAARSSNWYMSRLYVDTRKERGASSLPIWHLDVTYYTGSMDLVPHTPEACLLAGGRKVVDSSPVVFRTKVDGPWSRWWNGRVKFQRVVSVDTKRNTRSSDYYVFSFNGRPETSRLTVRRELTYPWVKHCYFAKIQFVSRTGQYADQEASDKAAEEFAGSILPEVLKALPTPDDVERLSSGG